MEQFRVFSTTQLIESIRSGPYKTTIHSISELVDNSIQAKASFVQLICIDKAQSVGSSGRKHKRIKEIGVFDNGVGMDFLTLRKAMQFGESPRDDEQDENGIGKFGMGLPNSSFSRSRSFTVWSWKNGKTYKVKLDIDEIKGGNLDVPEPIEEEIPKIYRKHMIGEDQISDSGTFVLWDELDKVHEKKSKNLLENNELVLGRKYRYQISSDDTRIHLSAFEQSDNNISWDKTFDKDVRANDPLYLMKVTSTPKLPFPYAGSNFFIEFGIPHIINVEWKGEDYVIEVKFSIVNPDIRNKLGEGGKNPGDSAPGKHAAKNVGISIVRAKRELEPDLSFGSNYDTTNRLWGAEVSFPPGLDDVFGVDFYKQSANNFTNIDLLEEAKKDDMTYEQYLDELKENSDPRIIINEVSTLIRKNISSMKKQLGRERNNTRNTNNANNNNQDPATLAGTKDTRNRINQGHTGESDKQETEADGTRKKKLSEFLEKATGDKVSAENRADFLIRNKLKFDFQSQDIGGSSFFSCESVGGILNININSSHPIHDHLWEILEKGDDESLIALKILLQAWSRIEDEAPAQRKYEYADFREDWGRRVRDQLRMAFDD